MIKSLTLQTQESPTAKEIRALLTERLDDLQAMSPQMAVLLTSHMEGDFASMLAAVREFFPQIAIAGCTTDGELSLHHGHGRDTAQLTFLSAERCSFSAGVGRNLSKRPEAAIREAFDQARQGLDEEPVLAVPLPDGLSSIALPLHQLLPQVLGDGITIVGGTAGDRFNIDATYQFFGDEVLTDSIVLLLIGGPLLFSTSNEHGRRPLGVKHDVGRVEANVVHEIGGRSAMEFYRSYIGDNVEEYRQFPLMLHPEAGTPFLASAAFFDEEGGSVAFVGAFPPRCRVQLSEAGREDVLGAADSAFERALEKYPGDAPQACMLFSCASRRYVLGTMAPQETSFLSRTNCVPNAFGFYTYGELAPDIVSGDTRLHSDTFVALFLGEED